MKKEDIIIENIKLIKKMHKEDKDGGYGVLPDIIQYNNSLDKDEQDVMREIMVNFVKEKIVLFGTALEFLSNEGHPDSAKYLRELLEKKKEDEEYAYYISYYLLRFGRNEDITLIKSLVKKYLIRRKISQWLQVVFELLKSDYKFSIDMIVKYIMIDCETFIKFSSSLMLRIVKLDEKVFKELMKRIRKKDGYKYKVISENIIEELKKPWWSEKYDKVKIKHLLEVLK